MAALAEIVSTSVDTFLGLRLPMTVRFADRITNEELMVISQQFRSYRMERNAAGELEIISPLFTEGGEWEAEVIIELGIWSRAHGGHVYSSNAGFTLPDTSMRSPDASWISEDKWGSLSLEQRKGFAEVCPEFLVEIMSESDSRTKLEEKMEMWLANGAQLAWLIDPLTAEVKIYREGTVPELLRQPDWVEADTVVTGFRLETRRMWEKG